MKHVKGVRGDDPIIMTYCKLTIFMHFTETTEQKCENRDGEKEDITNQTITNI